MAIKDGFKESVLPEHKETVATAEFPIHKPQIGPSAPPCGPGV